jgi:2-oxo-4-hydroxy-4-carboxy--5-ureidoimidazoline (OHCU) decarboxylase
VRDNPDRQHILDSGWARMNNSPTQERATALIEIANIANHRFDDFVADANPIHSARLKQFELK